jgi:hypothetical protein
VVLPSTKASTTSDSIHIPFSFRGSPPTPPTTVAGATITYANACSCCTPALPPSRCQAHAALIIPLKSQSHKTLSINAYPTAPHDWQACPSVATLGARCNSKYRSPSQLSPGQHKLASTLVDATGPPSVSRPALIKAPTHTCTRLHLPHPPFFKPHLLLPPPPPPPPPTTYPTASLRPRHHWFPMQCTA